jgi:hypothetical protein
MLGRIPKTAASCVSCVRMQMEKHGPCEYHRGLNGEVVEYKGPDQYVPSDWVKEIVGRRYSSSTGLWLCTGYDPRTGFWMRTLEENSARALINVSEAAIDRTFHRVRMTAGAFTLLKVIKKLGRLPNPSEAENVLLPLARETLFQNGYITREGDITPAGTAAKEFEVL